MQLKFFQQVKNVRVEKYYEQLLKLVNSLQTKTPYSFLKITKNSSRSINYCYSLCGLPNNNPSNNFFSLFSSYLQNKYIFFMQFFFCIQRLLFGFSRWRWSTNHKGHQIFIIQNRQTCYCNLFNLVEQVFGTSSKI